MSNQEDIGNTPPPGLPDPDGPTEEAPTAEASGGGAGGGSDRPRRFLRSRDDRVIAGVAGGLGRYFDIDPVIIRIAFAVSVLFGGLGAIAYVAIAIFVPADDGEGQPVPSGVGRGALQVLGVIALAFVAFLAFGVLAAAGAVATGLGFGLPVAIVVVLLGIALAVLSFRGGAKWLIVPALALTLGVGVAAAADLDLEGGVGSRDYKPVSATSIPADGYRLGVGRLAVDLRGIEWGRNRVLRLPVRIGAGQAVIAVPADVCVVADAHAGGGELRIAGQQADGTGVDLATGAGSRATPRLELDAEVDLGQLVVLNDDDADIGAHGRGWDRDDWGWGDQAGARAANTRACSG